MGCLSVHIARVGEGLSVSSDRVGKGLDLSCHRIGKGLEVSCGLVCSINTDSVLRVQPKYIFLMESNNYTEDVNVISNVQWHVS